MVHATDTVVFFFLHSVHIQFPRHLYLVWFYFHVPVFQRIFCPILFFCPVIIALMTFNLFTPKIFSSKRTRSIYPVLHRRLVLVVSGEITAAWLYGSLFAHEKKQNIITAIKFVEHVTTDHSLVQQALVRAGVF